MKSQSHQSFPPFEFFMQGRATPPHIEGRYNRWCEKKPREVLDESAYEKFKQWKSEQTLTDRESAIWTTHALTKSPGIEFIGFSNLYSSNPLRFKNGLTLVPGFFPDEDFAQLKRNPIGQLTMKMREKNRYIYDGWYPISEWTLESVRNGIRAIGETLSLFALRATLWFKWEPKYPPPNRTQSLNAGMGEVQEFEGLHSAIESLAKEDRNAVFRSLGWLSQSMALSDPAAILLFRLLAIESLADHVEKADSDSPFSSLQSKPLTRTERRIRRESCIKERLETASDGNLTEFVQQAYFHCIGSVRRKLQACLERVFGKDSGQVEDFFRKEDGLHALRNMIAHGSAETLDDKSFHRFVVEADTAEELARDFITKVLTECLGISPVAPNTSHVITLPANPDAILKGFKYSGPTHIAMLYL